MAAKSRYVDGYFDGYILLELEQELILTSHYTDDVERMMEIREFSRGCAALPPPMEYTIFSLFMHVSMPVSASHQSGHTALGYG